MQDLVVWSPIAHIANKVSIRRGSTRFPSLIRLAPCQTEEDGRIDVCGWQEGEWKTPTPMLIIPNEKVAVVISLSQQMLESPNDIMHEGLLSCWSCRSGFTFKISVTVPKRLVPWKVVTVLPSIQRNLLSRETTESRETAPQSCNQTRRRACASWGCCFQRRASPLAMKFQTSLGVIALKPNTTPFCTTMFFGKFVLFGTSHGSD